MNMALPVNPAAHTRADALPARLVRTTWRRLQLTLKRDPLAAVDSAADAVRLADQMLTATAVGRASAGIWSSVALPPLAALIHTASPSGNGQGIRWVRAAATSLHHEPASGTAWDHTQAHCNRPTTSTRLRTALPALRRLEPRQRDSITHVMLAAVTQPTKAHR
ncbi:hypothetical protein [Mycolicibacterium sp.]|uniref:hypothetical protein n=1 Tax=Mycolicibacterium sp. TaxID=2320850 RepID=UPI0037C912C8